MSSMRLAAAMSSCRGRFTSELSIRVLLFMVASTATLARIFREGMIPSRFNVDIYLATSLARRYLQRPPGTEVVDMYTQGFLHPLLYVPLLAFLRAIGITPPLQDGLAIAFVQALAVGLIALLAYLGSRALLNRGAAMAVSLLCTGPVLLTGNVENQLSPNGEILGSVLLLGIWAILVHRPPGRGSLNGVIGLSVAAFHLKYQLVPQVAALILGGGLGRRKSLRLLAISLVAALVVDLFVYRLGGSGIFSRAGSLLVDYIGIANSATPAHAKSVSSLLGAAVGLVSLIFTRTFGNPLAITAEAPQFLLAWAVWLVPLLRPQHHGPRYREQLIGAALLSYATIAAIQLPNRGYDHYLLLLIPTSVVVMTTGLAQFPVLSRNAVVPTRLAGPRTARPFVSICWAALLALAPVTALLFSSGLPLNRQLMASGLHVKATLPPETRLAGLHVYGWNYLLFGIQDTHSIDLKLDMLLAKSFFSGDTGDYIRALTGPQGRPRFVLDHVASSSKGGVLAAANFPPLSVLARRHGVDLFTLYKVRQNNDLGILYERIGDAPTERNR